jgi:YggT family protein
VILFARFWFQLCLVETHHPLYQFVMRVTQPIVKPLKRIVPRCRDWDLPALFLFCVLHALALILPILCFGKPLLIFVNMGFICLLILKSMIVLPLTILTYTIIGASVLNWILMSTPGYHPLRYLLDTCISPLLKPIRRWVPIWYGMDFSPLIAICLLQIFAAFIA